MKKLGVALCTLLCALLGSEALALSPGSITAVMTTDNLLTSDSNNCSGGAGPRAAYVGFRFTNTSGSALRDVRVTLGAFAAGFGLNNGQAATLTIGSLAAGASDVLYWHIFYPCHTASPNSNTLTLTLSDSNPGTVTINTGTTITSTSSLSANAGGQINTTTLGPGAVLGQVITYDVTYNFGQTSVGDRFNLQPAGNTSYNAGCFQLVNSRITSSNVPAITTGTADQLLFVAGAGQNTGGGQTNLVTVRYFIKYLCANTSTTSAPYASQTSGGQLKYSGNFGGAATLMNFPGATNSVSISKSADFSVVPAGAAVTYTVTLTNSSASFPTYVDQITDVLPSGATFGSIQSSSDVTAANSNQVPQTGSSGTLSFIGQPFTVSAGGTVSGSYLIPPTSSIRLIYTVNLSTTPGTYANSATATIGTVTTPPASISVQVVTMALTLTKTAVTRAYIGDTVTYTYTLTNTTTSGAPNLTLSSITDPLLGTLSPPASCTTLAPGASCSFTQTYPVTSSTPDPFTTTATATYTFTPTGTPSSASASATHVLDVLKPDLTISNVASGSFARGSTGTYTLTATNLSADPTTGTVTVSGTLPAGLTPTSATGTGWSCTISGQTVTCTRSDALSGAAYPPITVNVNVAQSAATPLSFTATVSGGADTNSTNNSATVNSTISTVADLSVTKTDGVSVVAAGSTVSYTITAANNGPSNLIGATLTDTLPASLTGATWTCAASSGSSCPASGSGNIVASLSLLSGGTATFTLNATLSASATGSVANTATVAVPGGATDPNSSNNSSTDTNSIVPAVDLAITKTAGASTAVPGSTLTYTLVARNNGPNPVTGATLTDTLPSGVTGGSWTCAASSGSSCPASGSGNIAANVSLLSGGTATFSLVVTVSPAATGTLSNTAGISAPLTVADTNLSNNSSTVTTTLTPSVNLSLSKTDGKTTTLRGDLNTYTITVSNSGPSNLVGATVTDALPSGLTGGSWTCTAPSGGSCTASGSGNISDTVNIPAGGSLTYSLSATVGAGASGTLSNTVSVSVPLSTTNTGASSATDTTSVLTYTVTKAVSSTTPVLPGTTLTYTIQITNTSLVAISGAAFTDALPAGTAYYPLSASLNGGSAFGTTYPFASAYPVNSAGQSSGVIAAGATTTISFKVVVNSSSPPASVSNQGYFTFTGGPSGGAPTDDPTTPAANDPTLSTVTAPPGYFINYEDGTVGSYNCTTNVGMDVGGLTSTGAAFGRSQANPPLNGLYHLVSDDLSSASLNAYTETPWLLFGGGNLIEFRHKISNLSTTNARIVISLVEAGTGLETVLLTYTYVAGDANVSRFVSQNTSVTGVYKVRIRFLGTPGSGSARGAVDDINTDATQATAGVGTAASPASGSACNYRLDPRVVKTGPATATTTQTVTYTITATNGGPATFQGTLTDAVPAGFTAVTWVCTAAGDADCDTAAAGTGASGSGNSISLTAVRIRPGSGNSVTLTVTATAATAGTVVNTALLTLPGGATDDLNPADNTSSVTTVISLLGVTVSGRVYADLQPNGTLDGGEDWSSGVAVRVNLVQGTTVVQSVAVGAGGGNFSFSAVVAGSYQLIVTTGAGATTAAAPAGWIFIQPQSGSLSLSVATADLSGQNLGLYNGSRLTGTVFRDDALGGGTANNSLQDGGEVGMGGVTVTASDGTSSLSTLTEAGGSYTLYIPATYGSSLTLSHAQAAPTGTNVAGAAIQLASSYNAAAARRRVISSFSGGQTYTGYNFGVVWASELRPNNSGQASSPGVATYRHTFRPGTLGSTILSMTGGLAYQVRWAAGCSAVTASDPLQPFPLSLIVDSTWPRDPDGRLSACELELLVLVPAGRPSGSVDIAQLSAALAWANNPALTDPRSAIDTTTVLAPGGLRLEKQVRNVTQNNPAGAYATNIGGRPGDTLEYCIAFRNSGTTAVSSAVLTDPIPFFTNYAPGTLRLDSAPLTDAADADTGELVGTLYVLVRLGTLTAGQTGQVCYRVTIR
ncbi:MAG: hypothetical protein SFU83_05320 [Meiothermus sp.]|nr:hypothetical protein [Meiothermus sp.]